MLRTFIGLALLSLVACEDPRAPLPTSGAGGASLPGSPSGAAGATAGDVATRSSALCPTVPALTAIAPLAPATQASVIDFNDNYALLGQFGASPPPGSSLAQWAVSSQTYLGRYAPVGNDFWLRKLAPTSNKAIGDTSSGMAGALSSPVFCGGFECNEVADAPFFSDLNENGTAVGGSAHSQAIKWKCCSKETLVQLGTLGGPGFAAAVNASDVVVGWSDTSTNDVPHAFLYDTTMHDLGTLGGPTSEAAAISSNGDVVGDSQTRSGEDHAFLWHAGTMQDLGTLGGTSSVAVAINSSSQVVGTSTTSKGETHVFFWSAGVMQDVGTLGGSVSTLDGTTRPLNDAGQVVGTSTTAAGHGHAHAFIWQLGVMRDLGTLPGGVESGAVAITPAGLVAGNSSGTNQSLSAFFVDPGACTLP
jgi:probable HAF family extracellular repeat protein